MTLQELRKPFTNITVEQHGEAQIGTQPGFIVTAELEGQNEPLTVTAASEKDALVYFLETYPPLPEIDPNVVGAQPIVTPLKQLGEGIISLKSVKPLE